MNATPKVPLVLFILSLVALFIPPFTQADPKQVNLGLVGRAADEGTEQTAEIATFVPGEDLAFVTDAANNELDAFDWSDPASPQFLFPIDLSPWGLGLTTTEDGRMLLVANEGEPLADEADADGDADTDDLSSTPGEAMFAGWINTREDDRGPEGMQFLTAAESPNGQPSILVTYEVSGTTSLYAITPAP